MKTIIKIQRRDTGFTQIANDVLRNPALSFKARGILAMVLSHSDSWTTTHAWIEEQGTEGREAIRSGIVELEAAGHLVQSLIRVAGRIVGNMMTWHEQPLLPAGESLPEDGKTVCGETPEDRKTVSRHPAASEEKTEQKKIIKKAILPKLPKPAPAEPKEKQQYDIGVTAARSVELDLLAPVELRPLWKQYQDYRTQRHYAKGPDRLAWTEASARAAAESINRAVHEHGERMVSDRILTALEKRWNGLNLQTLGKPYHNANNSIGSNSSGAKFETLAKSPSYKAADAAFTGEIR